MIPIICALDTHNLKKTIAFAHSLYNRVSMIKLGLEFFTAHGLSGVREIAKCNIPIFLDLKLHDIPSTVSRVIEVISHLNIAMVTLHVMGGAKMLQEALHAADGTNIKLIGVTVLTSIDNNDLNECGVLREVQSQVVLLAKFAKKIGLYGIVCSACEAQAVHKVCGRDFIVIVPGIRIETLADDQKRISTPECAINLGADYIVIGRLITQSADPIRKLEFIRQSLLVTNQ
ncbi:orotidine-5'-phosphate decarboxylase [Wolbachia endosymbiont of Howardula sp.]|uniref:orotidine-5'-phosphate decarboxylase n=1 Tax=Wolbachia endosymbiont of Howardula sp. TaxID=2916816 RepID=UPI00217D164A|nr:orotidine-5'-phosphate decarboxylase [Wolbachia endosymbiont of Howardula sp.]UWI83419.1 orotidine-5'-phosphate decarboxylase [Wolbachia endosymbiont of Howardula sp.]